jgi:hypothetical protein
MKIASSFVEILILGFVALNCLVNLINYLVNRKSKNK